MDAAIAVEGLQVTYRRGVRRAAVTALAGVDLAVHAGEIVGVLGPNGSGKTSLLEVLAGALRPSAGHAVVLGRDPADRALVGAVGYQPEGPLPLPSLSGRTFLRFCADLMALPAASSRPRTERLLTRFDLGHAADRPLGTYSTGMSRRLALAAALLAEPKVLLLDEPTAGLDPQGCLTVLEMLREVAATGTAVLMASHQLEEVEQVCDRVILLIGGRCRASGTLDALLGTGEHVLVVRDLPEAALSAVRAAIEQAGGELLRVAREREHLAALFRRVAS